jgi:uncharacterized protein YdhG (YjbR/CyaY superfamily)
MKSAAKTVTEYIASLPPDRRKELAAVRKLVKGSMPKGYREVTHWGSISWEIPLAKYADTYNGKPLAYVGLAAQKHHLSLYLMGAYMQPEQTAAIKEAFKKEGKRLDMGKACIRFRKAEDLPLKALARSIAAIPPGKYIVRYEEIMKKRK